MGEHCSGATMFSRPVKPAVAFEDAVSNYGIFSFLLDYTGRDGVTTVATSRCGTSAGHFQVLVHECSDNRPCRPALKPCVDFGLHRACRLGVEDSDIIRKRLYRSGLKVFSSGAGVNECRFCRASALSAFSSSCAFQLVGPGILSCWGRIHSEDARHLNRGLAVLRPLPRGQ